MAASSSESSGAPDNFQISTSDDESVSQITVSHGICQLCNFLRKKFYCLNCVRNGDFTHSTHHFSERFVDKRLRYLSLKGNLQKCNEECEQLLTKKKLHENYQTEIQRKTERIKLLHRLIDDKKTHLNELAKVKNDLLSNNQLRRNMLPKYGDKVKKIGDYVSDRLEKNLLQEEKRDALLKKIQNVIRNEINKLIAYVFPMSQTAPKSEPPDLSEIQDTVTALADATHTAYVRGKWILQDSGASSSGEIQYTVVGPSLPANGDYSAYSDWVAHNKDGVPAPNACESLPSMNPAYRISAALTFVTQLANLLSFYLDARLPFKLAYSDFCKKELSEQQFLKKIARLNANILYLCYTQRVKKLSSLNPHHTMENLTYLLNTDISDLGRIGYVDVSYANLGRCEDALAIKNLEPESDSGSDDDNSLRQEWESLPNFMPLDVTPAAALQNISSQQTTSVAGGLVTSAAASIASMWRGWTTGR